MSLDLLVIGRVFLVMIGVEMLLLQYFAAEYAMVSAVHTVVGGQVVVRVFSEFFPLAFV